MCSRIMRDPLVRQCVAEYQGEFIADASDGGFTKGTQWLVWKFESDSTLGDALSVRSSPWHNTSLLRVAILENMPDTARHLFGSALEGSVPVPGRRTEQKEQTGQR